MGEAFIYIPENQDAWRITLETGEDLSTATDVFIRYLEADTNDGVDRIEGEWDAIIDGDPANGRIYHDMTPGQVFQKGEWEFQSRIIWNDTRVSYGKPTTLWISEDMVNQSVQQDRIVAYYETGDDE